MQNSWKKHGKDNFKFEVVELVSDEDLLFSAEQKWINKTKCYDSNYGYNISIEASRPNCGDGTNRLNANFVFRNKITDIVDMKLDKNEKLVYYVLRDFAQHPSNCIMLNNIVPSFKELEPLVSLTERTIRDALKTLEQKNLLKLVQSGHKKAIYINPEYYSTGKELNIDTLDLFNLELYTYEDVENYKKKNTN